VSLWEPFTPRARREIVRAQEVAQMFGSRSIGTEHMAFALAEADDALGELLANAIDRTALREHLGAASQPPSAEMVFTPDAKRAIELAFEHARRLQQQFIAAAHLALGVLYTDSVPLALGVDPDDLRKSVVRIARNTTAEGEPQAARVALSGAQRAARPPAIHIDGEDPEHPVAAAIAAALRWSGPFDPELLVDVEARTPKGVEGRWTFRWSDDES